STSTPFWPAALPPIVRLAVRRGAAETRVPVPSARSRRRPDLAKLVELHRIFAPRNRHDVLIPVADDLSEVGYHRPVAVLGVAIENNEPRWRGLDPRIEVGRLLRWKPELELERVRDPLKRLQARLELPDKTSRDHIVRRAPSATQAV